MPDNLETIDFAELDDSALLAVRARMRAELERLPAPLPRPCGAVRPLRRLHPGDRRPRPPRLGQRELGATMNAATAVIAALPTKAARMLAVEILLAEPETLGDDVLESCLYLLRERLREE
jgi:hypothetical protein